jgi:hypothetical protein
LFNQHGLELEWLFETAAIKVLVIDPVFPCREEASGGTVA